MTTPAPKRSRWKLFLANSALLLGSLVVTAVLVEVAVRLVMPQQLILSRPDIWEPADTVGYVHRPNIDTEVNTGQGAVELMTDAEGFRVGKAGRTSGIPVLLLGDSFMEALQVEYEASLAGLLETSLDQAVGEPVAIRNAGISGWAPGQYLARARMLLPRDRYGLVITAVYVGNDAKPLRLDYTPPREATRPRNFRLPTSLSKTELVYALLYPLNSVLETRSHAFVLLRRKLELLRKKLGLSANYFPVEFLKSEGPSERWAVTADVCADIAEAARQQGAASLFVLIPTNFQVDPSILDQYVRGFGIDTATVALDQPTERLKEELTKRGLRVIDALPDFRRVGADEPLYGVVDEHLSAAGHRTLTDLVTPVATELLSGTCSSCDGQGSPGSSPSTKAPGPSGL